MLSAETDRVGPRRCAGAHKWWGGSAPTRLRWPDALTAVAGRRPGRARPHRRRPPGTAAGRVPDRVDLHRPGRGGDRGPAGVARPLRAGGRPPGRGPRPLRPHLADAAWIRVDGVGAAETTGAGRPVRLAAAAGRAGCGPSADDARRPRRAEVAER